jgi:hypothetical protein
MRWHVTVLGAAILCSSFAIAIAQTAAAPAATGQVSSDPPLHRRDSSSRPAAPPDVVPRDASKSTLPADASGEYLIDEAGSTVEVTLEAGKISGYVTRMGDEQSDKDTPLTFFFDQVTVAGHHLSFTTKKVHGVWYEFDGSIERGDAKTMRDQNGYYRLMGVWTAHNDVRNSQQREQVSFKSTPREVGIKL